MLGKVLHIGLTVTDLEKSIKFYRDVLGLKLYGKIVMQGKETDDLFGVENLKVNVAYLNGSKNADCPPIELLEFSNIKPKNEEDAALNKVSISEVCFSVNNIDETYERLKSKGVEFLSEPKFFDFTNQGFGKSKAVYFKDPDGIILELIENLS